MNLAGKRISPQRRPGLHRLPAPLRDDRRPVSGAGATAERESHHSRRGTRCRSSTKPFSPPAVGLAKRTTPCSAHVHGQSDTREAVTLADCWSHQPGRRSTMPAPASALSRNAESRLVHRSASQQRWGFDGEPPKPPVIKDSGTKDRTGRNFEMM
jgi:hypothetical protein